MERWKQVAGEKKTEVKLLTSELVIYIHIYIN